MTDSDQPEGGKKPLYYATVEYKRWVRRRLQEEGWTLKEFATRVTRTGYKCTDEALWQLLGELGEPEPAPPSNTTLMPGINEVLGAAPPPVCDPDDQLAQLQDMIADRWRRLSPHSRADFMNAMRGLAGLADGTVTPRKAL